MNQEPIKLDYSLKTVEERNALVEKILAAASPSQLTSKYIEILGDYILDIAVTKEEKKNKEYLTKNRMVTINKRETSYEELVDKFENGEDGVYNLINSNKNIFLDPKIEISAADLEEVPGLKELREEIIKVEARAKAATGKQKYLLKKQAIEMRQQQYILKEAHRCPIQSLYAHSTPARIELQERVYFDSKGEPCSDDLITFFKPEHCSAILCNYEYLKEGLRSKFHNDFHYMLKDFDKLIKETFAAAPLYADLVQLKIAGRQNIEIQKELENKHGIKHSVEYISSLWRNKIPKMLAEKAKENYLLWYYTEVERGNWKKCSRCGQIKLAHNRFFSKNNTSKDGYYSICKECRNKKK
jgi:hypothetical protein